MTPPAFEPRPSEGLNVPNVVRMLAARVAKSADRPAYRFKEGGAWKTLTWRETEAAVRELAAGLVDALEIRRGDRVALLSRPRIEWTLFDFAIAYAGAVSVPIYTSLPADAITFILRDSGAKAVIAEHPGLVQTLLSNDFRSRIAGVAHMVTLDARGPADPHHAGDPAHWIALDDLPSDGPARTTLTELRDRGAQAVARVEEILTRVRDDLGLDDELTYVYTSGTTGEPKGVVLTHRNLVYESWAIKNVIPVDETDEQLVILPLSHIFSRHMVWGAVEQGAVTSFAESMEKVSENLQEVAPTYMGAVPRVYEKVYARILAEVHAGSSVKRGVFEWCLDVGRKVSICKQRGQIPSTGLMLKMAVAERLVFHRIKQAFGGRLRFFVSGGAPLSKEIAEFFHAAGILILEGYGLTETTGATNVNRPDRFRFGTVGPAMPGCEIRLADDGEVLVRGHNVMAGYHDRPEDTAAVIDAQGWFHTGDIGELTDGFLRITDRKKDLLKTAGGKYIAPAPIENRLKQKEGIAEVVMFGDERPYAVALVVLDEAAMMRVSDKEGLGCRNYEQLTQHPRIRQIIAGHIDDINGGLASFETIKKFDLVPAPLAEKTGELTPTLKVRRKVVRDKYQHLIDKLYA